MRPKIGMKIRRLVRQACHFGCVVCGSPIVDVDHIENWSIVKSHEIRNLVLLCPNHHREKSSGLLNKEYVLRCKERPFNSLNDLTPQYKLHLHSVNLKIKLGNCTFEASDLVNGSKYHIVSEAGSPRMSVRIEDDFAMISADFSDQNGNLVLRIKDNFITHRTSTFDAQLEGRQLKIWRGAKKIVAQIEFKPPNEIVIWRSRLKVFNGFLDIDKNGMSWGDRWYLESVHNLSRSGIVILENERSRYEERFKSFGLVLCAYQRA